MRMASRSEDGKKVYVHLSGDDQKETESSLGIVRRDVGGGRVIFNVDAMTVAPYGVITQSFGGRSWNLTPWAQILWMDSEFADELR